MKTLNPVKTCAAIALAVTSVILAVPAHAIDVHLIGANSGHALDIRDRSASPGVQIVQNFRRDAQKNQVWEIAGLNKDKTTIVNKNSKLCLTTSGKPGRTVYQWPCDNSPGQVWEIHHYQAWIANSSVLGQSDLVWFTNPASGLVLDVNQNSYQTGAPIVVWYGNGQRNQSFVVVSDVPDPF